MVIFILILIVVYTIGAILTAMFIQNLFYIDYIDERRTSTTKWILSMIFVLLSFVGLILSFLYCAFTVLFEDVVIDNYKKWDIYKIFFRK